MREAALDAIAVLLGAEASIKAVKRVAGESELSAQELPAVLMADDGEEEILYKTSDLADVYFTTRLIGVVRDRENLSQAMNTLDTTIKSAIAADITLGGTIANMTILPMTDKNLDDTDSVATFVRPIRVFYEATVTGGL